MKVTFKKLTKDQRVFVKDMYNNSNTSQEAQDTLSYHFKVSTRTIRNWFRKMGLTSPISQSEARVMVYDIETSRVLAKVWWTGKQFVGHKNLQSEPKIISICYKWMGESKIHQLTWDKNQCDKSMLKDFLEAYNTADMVVGQNNDRFDNRWVNARAMKHGLVFNTFIKSFDIMKQTKRLFRLPSYSMDYITKFLNVENKLSHEGIKMWDMIESGTKAEQKEYLQKMLDYNIGDIVSTEAMYVKLRKYMGHKVHFGVLAGLPKYSSPTDGSVNLELLQTQVSPAGTISHVMVSKTDGVQFKLSNREYLNYLNNEL